MVRPVLSLSVRDLVLMGLFAGVVAALGLLPKITLPLGVPITAQSMGLMLAGAILGARRGAGAMLLFLLIALAGLPVLAGGRTGLGAVFSPTGGFFLGFPVAAAAVGLIGQALGRPGSPIRASLACLLGGVGVLYLCGVPYWIAMTGQPVLAVLGNAALFLPGDILKAVLAGLVAATVHRGLPALGTR
ncbi:biotin transporter BioY [Pararhodospirillum oryzae]|uniref:Biotin transporter n=1 Tax=Pararhodospirillum oryzae TaxID=478448 RepID=A0A512H5Z3_9PROT|nr:biotin transporter BioY [Pararhodospirillum oryzae]GEO80862.1 BioY family transporter [Pararhodospirillum oryzae]